MTTETTLKMEKQKTVLLVEDHKHSMLVLKKCLKDQELM